MAQSFNMPPDTNEEEKIIGGYINLHQTIWLVGGAGIGAVFTIIFFRIVGAVALICLVPPIAVGAIFAFTMKEDMTLFKYLRYKRRFKKSSHYYINYGNHQEFDVVLKEEEDEE